MKLEGGRARSWLGVCLFATGVLSGCGEEASLPYPTGPQETVILTPDAPPLPGETECKVVKTTNIPVNPAVHVADCTSVTYATNPPSGGDHWGTWAAFKKYTTPVPREMYVHDMEHGAVVLSYRYADACPDVVMALETVFDDVAADPLCVSAGAGPKARLVLTPDPELDTPIAASAWGATYTATCIDPSSLAAFVSAVYGRGPESTCFNGKDIEAGAGPTCSGG